MWKTWQMMIGNNVAKIVRELLENRAKNVT